jgi:PadR family transcriptional regulator, regulatory protein PadR
MPSLKRLNRCGQQRVPHTTTTGGCRADWTNILPNAAAWGFYLENRLGLKARYRGDRTRLYSKKSGLPPLLDNLGEHPYSFLDGLSLDRLGEPDLDKQLDLLQGTLDLLILKAVSLGPLHGYGVLLRIQQISGQTLVIQQGSLYPALYRLEHQGAITSDWGESENNRKAKFYRLTAAGRTQLEAETKKWQRMADLMGTILSVTAEPA